MALLLAASGAAAHAQDDVDEELPMDATLRTANRLDNRDIRRNPAQLALEAYRIGMRDFERAERLALKARTTEDAKKVEKTTRKAVSTYKLAVSRFSHAIQWDPELIEAYSSIGLAFQRLGDFESSYKAHYAALERNPNSIANFRGRAQSLLGLGLVDEVTADYERYAWRDPERAEVLMEEIERWLAAKLADPGDTEAAAVSRLQRWVDEKNDG